MLLSYAEEVNMAKWWIGAVFSLVLGSFLIGAWAGSRGSDWMLSMSACLLLIGILLLWTAYRNEVEQAYDRGVERGKEEQNEEDEEEEEEDDSL